MDQLIVFGTAAVGMALVLAWLLVPGLRERMERPKHLFQSDVRSFDQLCAGSVDVPDVATETRRHGGL